jgi:pimeloyl-ACP methyl ester carboxylesterase
MPRIRAQKPPKLARFRHADGRARFDIAYDAALASWPEVPSPVDVPTRFGSTRVNTCGASSGAPIVLLHGMMMTSTSWSPNVAALGERHRVFAVDTICDAGKSVQERAIGGGADLAAWIDDVLAGLELEHAHLVGLSYGSWIAINQALRSPARLSSITAIEPPGVITRGGIKIVWEMVRAGVARSDRALDRLTRVLGNGKLPPAPLFAVLRGAFLDFKVVQPFAELLDDEQLRSIATPVLLLFGELSPMCDAARAVDRALRVMPHVQAEVVPGTAHTPTIENPQLLDRRILRFIDDIERTP